MFLFLDIFWFVFVFFLGNKLCVCVCVVGERDDNKIDRCLFKLVPNVWQLFCMLFWVILKNIIYILWVWVGCREAVEEAVC